eukprot:XP_028353869.1 mitochondrial cardiolipin hydrolase [Physeter catodon]
MLFLKLFQFWSPWVFSGCLLGPLGVGSAGAVWAGARGRQAGAQAQWAMGAECAGASAPGRRAHVARERRAHRRSGRWALNAQAQVGGRRARRRSGRRAHVGGGASAAAGEMGSLRWPVVAAVAAGLALALEALPAVLSWLWAGRRPRPRREVLFFPSRVTCTETLLRVPGAAPSGCPCNLPHGESSLSRLLRALLAARASLELCLFAFSSPQLGRAVQLLHQRGVRVRVVTDCDYMALNGSQIGLLRKAASTQPQREPDGPVPRPALRSEIRGSPARLQVNEAARGPGALLGEGLGTVLRVTTPESPLTGTWGKSPISMSVFLVVVVTQVVVTQVWRGGDRCGVVVTQVWVVVTQVWRGGDSGVGMVVTQVWVVVTQVCVVVTRVWVVVTQVWRGDDTGVGVMVTQVWVVVTQVWACW